MIEYVFLSMLFKDIPGLDAIKQKLIQTINEQRVSHSQLFLGPEGSGNLALAIAYSQYLACKNKSETDSCGSCSSCVKYNNLAHPDLHFAYPVANTKAVKSKALSKDFIADWRELIKEHHPFFSLFDWLKHIQVENKQGVIGTDESAEIIHALQLKPYESEFKTMVIWMPEKMNASAANKLLKIIEEPPQKTLFLFVANSDENIIKTVLSRTQIVKIPAFTNQDISSYLSSEHSISEEEASNISLLSDGSLSKALHFLYDDSDSNQNAMLFVNWMRLGFKADVQGLIEWGENISKMGREAQKNFLSYTLSIIRESMMMNKSQNYSSMVPLDFGGFDLSKFAPFIHEDNIEDIYMALNEASYNVERNANPKILFLDLSINISKLIRRKPAKA